jgi:4-hydroxy-3-methylbut-2-enyl diphosphate reductase IspH
MIVLGSAKSSNTRKLFDVCKANCKNVILMDTVNPSEIKN